MLVSFLPIGDQVTIQRLELIEAERSEPVVLGVTLELGLRILVLKALNSVLLADQNADCFCSLFVLLLNWRLFHLFLFDLYFHSLAVQHFFLFLFLLLFLLLWLLIDPCLVLFFLTRLHIVHFNIVIIL